MTSEYCGHPVIVFALEHYNPLGHIRSLGENGISPIYISIKRRGPVACLSKYISKCHFADTVEEGYQLLLKEYGHYDRTRRPFVIFSDDKSVGYFDLHYDEVKDKFIFFNAGRTGRINEFMDKQRILELAKKHGFQTLQSWVVPLGKSPRTLSTRLSPRTFPPTPAAGNPTCLSARMRRRCATPSPRLPAP